MDQPQPIISPIPPINESSQKSHLPFILFVLLILISCFTSAYLFWQNTLLKQQLSRLTQASSSPLPTFSPSPLASPTVETSSIYSIKLQLKTSQLPSVGVGQGTLVEYLNQVLNLPTKTLTQLFYDSNSNVYDSNKGPYQSKFYIHFNNALALKNFYADEFIEVTVQPEKNNLLPYLIKIDYCEQDSDCEIGNSICTVGAFNHYRLYHDPPWGCGPASYKDNFSWFVYGNHDDELNCDLDSLKFDGVKCVNSQCAETGYQKVCMDASNNP